MSTNETTPQALLKRAAALLDEHGWTQDEWIDSDGRMCLMGAVRFAAAEADGIATDRIPHHIAAADPLESDGCIQAWRNALVLLGDLVNGPPDALDVWNDELGRTSDEVVELLHRAAGGSR